jgi:phosphate transport system substrate-binding protein
MKTKMGFKLMIAAVLVMVSVIPASYSSNLSAQGPVTINGAGASFPFPPNRYLEG